MASSGERSSESAGGTDALESGADLAAKTAALEQLREHFPVCNSSCYLNAGTDGPLAAVAAQAAQAEIEHELSAGRTGEHFERRHLLAEELRGRYARLFGCKAGELALTTCTSEGVALILSGMEWQAGEEILTSDEEHPGLLGSLQAVRDLHGVQIRMLPLKELPDAIGAQTRLIACSHVSWVSGALAPTQLSQCSARVPVLLDGAQGAGAVACGVEELGCDAYAGSGQKWLCGPDGIGMLYVSDRLSERLAVGRRGYGNFQTPNQGLSAELWSDARRFDAFSLGAPLLAEAIAAFDVLDACGWSAVHASGQALAGQLASEIERSGRKVSARGASTLVSFSSPAPQQEREQLAAQGIIVRDLPGHPLLRASVGAWNDASDLDRLLEALADGR